MKCFKGLLTALVLTLGVRAMAYAGAGGLPTGGGQGGRGIGINSWSYVTQAIYASTHTNAATDTSGNSVIVTTQACLIHTVNINTAGSSSKLEIYNAQSTTTQNQDRRIANIDTTSKTSLHYDLYIDSGFSMYNQGATPADITITFEPRK